jgi:hypothetical protein
MANCIKTLGAYYGRPTSFEKVFPSSRPWSVRTVAPPKLTLGTDFKTKFVTMTVLTVAAFVYIIFMLIYVKIVRLLENEQIDVNLNRSDIRRQSH